MTCDLCGDVGVLHLHSRCHPSAPLRVEIEGDRLSLFCYLPECGRLVASFRVREDGGKTFRERIDDVIARN